MHGDVTYKKILKYVILIICIALLVVGAGSTGYYLTQRYKSTITNTYNDLVNNVTGKINNIEDNILDNASEVSEK